MNNLEDNKTPIENQASYVSEDVALPKTMRKLVKEGVNIEFVDGDNVIKFHGSAFSGMETVFFNDEEVSKSRHLTFSSRHLFTNKEHSYELDVLTKSMRSGVIELSLMKDSILISRKSTCFEKGGLLSWRTLGAAFLQGLAIGVGIAFIIDLIF